jgi:TetR/AcrR family transcriptional regulator, cholesterol catabolism regulator
VDTTGNGRATASSTRIQLLRAAAMLFRRNGYEATTIRMLARQLGIQSASLYYHIGKKEDLLYELSVEALREIDAAVGEAVRGAGTAIERLEALIHAHVETALAYQDAHAVMLLELRSLSPDRMQEVIGLRTRYERLVERVVAEAQAADALRGDTAPRLLVLALLNLLNWTIFWYRSDGALSRGELADVLTTLYVDGAGARPPSG